MGKRTVRDHGALFVVSGRLRDGGGCEYDGSEVRGSGQHRKWKTYLKSGNEELTLANMRGKGERDADGWPILAFAFYYGNAAYYMGEKDTWEREEPNLDRLLYWYQNNDNQIGNGYYDAETAYEKFSFRVILWDCAPPAENTFE